MATDFFIIKQGSVNVLIGDQIVRTETENTEFGARAILLHETRSATVTAAVKHTEIWVCSQEVFNEVIDSNVRELLAKRMLLQDNTIRLEDLGVIKKLGTGKIFTVHLVVHKLAGILYALKSVSRDKIAKYRLSDNVMSEKNVLLRIDHSGIEHLVKTFKDDHRIYYLC